MPNGRRSLGLLLPLFLLVGASAASAVRPISDAHRSAAAELFASAADGSIASLEETYEALRTFQILKVGGSSDLSGRLCQIISDKATTSELKDLFYVLKIRDILGCHLDVKTYNVIGSKLQAVIKDTNSLLDIYYSVVGLLSMKAQGSNVVLADADNVFHAIKVLGQSDGRWRYDTNSAESSTYAAGLALEALAGVISLADSEIDPSVIGVIKNDISKLFDTIKSYDDGTFYFDEERVDASEYIGPVATSASVVRGVTSFAAVASGKLNIPGESIFGLAKFFLSVGIPGSPKDFFNQIESLFYLENNRVSIPLILSLTSNVISLTYKEQLKVEVATVFGSAAPPLTVSLVKVLSPDLKEITAVNKELQFDPENNVHFLDFAQLKVDVGKYLLAFEISLKEVDQADLYATGGQNTLTTYFTGSIKVDKAEIAITDSDGVASVQKLDLLNGEPISVSATHLHKLRLSFQLVSPLGHSFKPHQVLLKLKHESKVEHLFLVESSSRQFKSIIDFLGLVEKFYYLSGKYEIELSIGDAAMENSFQRTIGYVDLDLPESPEKAPRPPQQPEDIYSRFKPKEEITHIFRKPEKRPPREVSLAFTGLTVFPLAMFLFMLLRLKVNIKGFPSAAGAAGFAALFHVGIAAVLLLYIVFWFKLDLFTTLKTLSFLLVFVVFAGHRTLSHLASTSAKHKTA